MTTTVELIAAVFGGGALSSIVVATASRLSARDAKKQEETKADAAVAVAKIEADTDVSQLMASFIGDMREERRRLIAEGDAKAVAAEQSAAKHIDCLKLVGEMSGRIDMLEPRLDRTEAKLEDCERAHRDAKDELAKFKRSVGVELAKRPASNPGFEKVKP